MGRVWEHQLYTGSISTSSKPSRLKQIKHHLMWLGLMVENGKLQGRELTGKHHVAGSSFDNSDYDNLDLLKQPGKDISLKEDSTQGN